ncbi:MAG: FHA domain-containing protein [Verrucomicrobia bacterium]|nr:FHA domain-containing protein [Verrucomicrobiota bacterium]
MVQLDILSGSKAGHRTVVRQFPFSLGRSAQAQLRVEDSGVWDHHLELALLPGEGFVLKSSSAGATLLNGEQIQSVLLRNGDLVEAGSVKMRFGFSPISQSTLRVREVATWLALAALCFVQVALIYWLTD